MNKKFDGYHEKIRLWVGQGKTQAWIAKRLQTSQPAVSEIVKHLGLKMERRRLVGPLNPNWKGGKTRHNLGYVMVYCPDHPSDRSDQYVYEHRLLMEKELGRYLRKDEVVHHINGIKNDNRIENLMVFRSNGAHTRHERTGVPMSISAEGLKRRSESGKKNRGRKMNLSEAERERRRQTCLRWNSSRRQQKEHDADQTPETADRLTA